MQGYENSTATRYSAAVYQVHIFAESDKWALFGCGAERCPLIVRYGRCKLQLYQ